MATKKTTARRLKATEINSVSKSLKNAIIGCTEIIDSKETIYLIDGTDAKKEFKRLRKTLIDANNFFGWSIEIKK